MSALSDLGNPRNKVALKQGRSLMDWIRLTNSGADLTGTGGKLKDVSLQELSRHNKRNDAWLAIRGPLFSLFSHHQIVMYTHFCLLLRLLFIRIGVQCDGLFRIPPGRRGRIVARNWNRRN